MGIWKSEPKQFDNFVNEEMDALATLQNNFIAAPVLALPCCAGHITPDVDAWDK